jgi:predicted TIM-barrel fold metal-dependent hydrolase
MGPGWSWDGGTTVRAMGLVSVGSENPRKIGRTKRYDEIDPGCYDPRRRIEVMDIDGVGACLLFASGAGFVQMIPDDDFHLECVRVYNDAVMDWAIEGDASRIFPAALIPHLGIEHAVAELERVAKKGFVHYMFNQWPSGNTYPSAVDDPFWELLQETGMTVSFHGYGGGRPKAPLKVESGNEPQLRLPVNLGQEMIAAIRGAGLGSTVGLGIFILDGMLERFPKLKVGLIETSAGWLPAFAERLDEVYLRHRWLGGQRLKRLPSESVKRLKINIDREWLGVKHRQVIGVDNIMFGTDFPHIGSFYPHTRFYIELAFQGVPAEETERMLWSNAANLYGVN